MAAEFDQLFNGTYQPYQAAQSEFRANGHFAPQNGPYNSFSEGYLNGNRTPLTATTDSNQSPTPSSRLAGEPAFCVGRHCCQWTVAGYTCNNHYPSAEDLDKHVAADHAGRNPSGHPSGDYHCHWAGCGKTESFGNKPKLTRHLHSHTGHKPHQCRFPGCSKGFVTKEQLKNHETTHTKTREHICPQCGKGFAVKTALTSHMNVHKGAKPYICDECGKGFADSSNLSKHKAIHKRAALKISHTRRQSNCHGCASTVASHLLISPGRAPAAPVFASPYLPDFATPSIEQTLPEDYCALPCFDTHCSDRVRLPCTVSPCRSAPCSNRECSPSCIEPCDLQHCDLVPEPCDLQICPAQELCDLPACTAQAPCNLADCMQDCTQFCGDHFDCFCGSDDEATLPTPSTVTSVPVQGHGNTAHQRIHRHVMGLPSDDFDFGGDGPAATMGSTVESLEHTDHGLSEGFKQLNEFIHSEFCGCADDTNRFS